MRPRFITAMRSEIESASVWSWVTMMKVVPRRACSRLSSTCICSRKCASSADSGSSSKSTRGSQTRARARATRWLLPAGERRDLGLDLVGEVHEVEGACDPAADRLCLRQLAQRQSEADVLGDVHVREERIVLEHRVDGPVVGTKRGDVAPVEQHAPARSALESGDDAEARCLPAAGRPEKGQELAAVSSRDRRDRGRRCLPETLWIPHRDAEAAQAPLRTSDGFAVLIQTISQRSVARIAEGVHERALEGEAVAGLEAVDDAVDGELDLACAARGRTRGRHGRRRPGAAARLDSRPGGR